MIYNRWRLYEVLGTTNCNRLVRTANVASILEAVIKDIYEHIGRPEPLERLKVGPGIDRNDLAILTIVNAAIARINELAVTLDVLDTQNLLLAERVKALEDERQQLLDDLEEAA